MNSKGILLIITIFTLSLSVCAQNRDSTLTESLVTQFNDAWNKEDISKMKSLMEPSAFFKSPFQLRYGLDTVAATVLKTNPPRFKYANCVESYSHIEKNMAWSIGKFALDIYDKGIKTAEEQLKGEYIYVFVRKNKKGDWKLQMMIFHEPVR